MVKNGQGSKFVGLADSYPGQKGTFAGFSSTCAKFNQPQVYTSGDFLISLWISCGRLAVKLQQLSKNTDCKIVPKTLQSVSRSYPETICSGFCVTLKEKGPGFQSLLKKRFGELALPEPFANQREAGKQSLGSDLFAKPLMGLVVGGVRA